MPTAPVRRGAALRSCTRRCYPTFTVRLSIDKSLSLQILGNQRLSNDRELVLCQVEDHVQRDTFVKGKPILQKWHAAGITAAQRDARLYRGTSKQLQHTSNKVYNIT